MEKISSGKNLKKIKSDIMNYLQRVLCLGPYWGLQKSIVKYNILISTHIVSFTQYFIGDK